jgi:hypothetical protein
LMAAILTRVGLNLNMVLMCISLWPGMVSMFSCVLVIWTSSFEKALFISFAYFFIGLLIFDEFIF